MSLTRKALIVSYFFPPRPGVGGLRAQYLAHYLPEHGWATSILTADLDGAQPPAWSDVRQTSYTDVVAQTKRLVGIEPSQSTFAKVGVDIPKISPGSRLRLRQKVIFWGYRLVTYPDPMRGWYRHGAAALSALLAKESYDAIISTSPPVTAHFIVAKACKSKLPWLADLRDLWTDNPYYPGRLRRFFDDFFERRVLSGASAITTVSEPLAKIIAGRHPNIRTFGIPNAFDPEEWRAIPFVTSPKCTLVYAGHMRDPRIMFEALARELEAGFISAKDFQLVLYATPVPWLLGEIKDWGLTPVVALVGTVPRFQVLEAERAATANVILMSYLPGEEAGYPAKLFEYFGAGRPIIGIGPPNSAVGELIVKAGGLYSSTVAETRLVLRTVYEDFRLGRGRPLAADVVSRYTAQALAKQFAQVLDGIVDRQH